MARSVTNAPPTGVPTRRSKRQLDSLPSSVAKDDELVGDPAADELNDGRQVDSVADDCGAQATSTKRKAAGAKHKPSKKLASDRKAVVWTDLTECKGGDEPALDIFPLEVLDLIISVDSDLELRDHLALAGTCRSIRSCYRDDVFQILFQVAFPAARLSPPHVPIDRDGSYTRNGYDLHRLINPEGPFERSLSSGRHLFSGTRSRVGAGGWTGWGLRSDELAAHELVVGAQKVELERACLQELGEVEWTDALEVEHQHHWIHLEVPEAWKLNARDLYIQKELELMAKKRTSMIEVLRQIHGLDAPLVHGGMLETSSDHHDPWPSEWRNRVADAVNTPLVNKTQAKADYKYTESDLRSLKERTFQGAPKSSKFYSRAAVQVMALRKQSGLRSGAKA